MPTIHNNTIPTKDCENSSDDFFKALLKMLPNQIPVSEISCFHSIDLFVLIQIFSTNDIATHREINICYPNNGMVCWEKERIKSMKGCCNKRYIFW